ncbi:MAG: dihydrofolate reductase family protein, partial [Bdellovibrionota bacterium]
TIFHQKTTLSSRSLTVGSILKQVSYQEIKLKNEGLCLESIVNYLGEIGVHDVWVEAGPTLFNAFLKEKLVQTAYVYLAPKFLGAGATPALLTEGSWFENAKSIEWSGCGRDGVCEVTL